MGADVLKPRSSILWICALLFCGVPASEATLDVDGARFAKRVVAIELHSDTRGLDPDHLWQQIEIVIGEPLDPIAVRRTLLNIHASGIASDVRISTRSAPEGGPDGVVVIVSIVGDYRLERVEIEGNTGVRRSDLRSRLEAQAGAVLHEDQLLRGVFRLQDFYAERGYRVASVRLEVELDHERKTAVAIYRIESGERPQIAEVSFHGELGPFTPDQLLDVVDLRPGHRDAPRQLEEDRERLRRFLLDRGYRRARVESPEVLYEEATDSVTIRHELDVGPHIDVEVVGAELEKLRKRGLLPFLGQAGFDDALVEQSVDRIRRDYQSRGYYDVEVTSEIVSLPPEESSDGQAAERLVLTIEPGELARLVGLDLEGNDAFSDAELLPLFATPPSGGTLVDAVLSEDLTNLRSFYALQGFVDAEIGSPQVDRAPAVGAVSVDLSVTVPIREGLRRTVSVLRIEGVDSIALAELEPLPLRDGGPYHPQHVEETVRRIRAAYEERGFDRVLVDSEVDWSGDELMAEVKIRVVEGRRTLVDRVIVRGNLVTRTRIVARTAGLQPGDPLSRGRLLEAQRRLYGLGVFERVEVEAAPRRWRGATSFSGEGEAERRDVVIRVSEARRWRLSYGASYDSEDGIGGLFSASYANVLGRAATLRLDTRASQRENRFRLLLMDRIPGTRSDPLIYALYRVGEDISDFRSTRYGAQVEAITLVQRVRFGLLFDYRNVDLEDLRPEDVRRDSILDIDRDLVAVQIASLTGTVIWDRRDNPILPADGFSTIFQIEEAFPLFSANEQFTRGFFQLTGYQPLGPLGTLAASLRLGAIEPHHADRPIEEAIPIAERYFGGGATTHRAYERDYLGIPGETIIERTPIGGNGLALVNLDYRFPIVGSLRGVLFGDSGNVWADWRDIRLDEFLSGVGVGLRYDSPVGAIRLEVGWKLDPLPWQDREVYFLSIGNPF